MIEIRIHGRGGQGAVTAAELIAVAAYKSGKITQAFPSFGVERRGAPVESYARISDKPIRLREQIYHPSYVIILDATLFDALDVLHGIKKNTVVVVNTRFTQEEILKKYPNLKKAKKLYLIDATKLGLMLLGAPIINTIMLGFFAGITKLISTKAIEESINERFSKALAEKNVLAMKEAFNKVI